jgi:hypothetical protein
MPSAQQCNQGSSFTISLVKHDNSNQPQLNP